MWPLKSQTMRGVRSSMFLMSCLALLHKQFDSVP